VLVDITKDLKKYIPIFQQAHDQAMNESDTSMRISKFCETVLGYDLFNEISREHAVKERNVDYAVKVDGKVQFFIEVKQAGVVLKEKHVEQASNYAANAGVSWVILSNGIQWNMYHLSFDEGIQIDLVWTVDLSSNDTRDASAKLGMLHRKNIVKGCLDDCFTKKKVLSPKSIIQAIFHENTLHLIKLHLKRTSGVKVDEEDIVEHIKNMISKETWEIIGDVKIIRKRRSARIRPVSSERAGQVETPTRSDVPPSQESS
jgi:predicted type IV restriction endonuclease